MVVTIQHRRHFLEPQLPHIVFIDGHVAAIMKGDILMMEIPTGRYELRIQCGGPLPLRLLSKLLQRPIIIDLSLSSTAEVTVEHKKTSVDHHHGSNSDVASIEFRDREKMWNILFDIDLIVWLVSLFVTMPPLYRWLSDIFFILWLVRLIVIRKQYYTLSTTDGGGILLLPYRAADIRKRKKGSRT